MSSKAVVIGGSGFLGSHLADTLSDSGFEVVVYDRDPSRWLRDDQRMVIGDVFDTKTLRETLRGARYVYHLAGVADIAEARVRPSETIRTNILGCTEAIEACLAEKVERLLFASTVYVYSNNGSFYRVSKQSAELIIEAYAEELGLEYTVLRYGSLYGPRSQMWNGLKNYVDQAIRTGSIDFPGTGEERREYIHVKDAARLSVDVLAPQYANSCVTLTGTQVYKSRELLSLLCEILGKDVSITFTPPCDNVHYVMTSYRYTPRAARKIVPSAFYDLGQGVLELIEEVNQEIDEAAASTDDTPAEPARSRNR